MKIHITSRTTSTDLRHYFYINEGSHHVDFFYYISDSQESPWENDSEFQRQSSQRKPNMSHIYSPTAY